MPWRDRAAPVIVNLTLSEGLKMSTRLKQIAAVNQSIAESGSYRTADGAEV